MLVDHTPDRDVRLQDVRDAAGAGDDLEAAGGVREHADVVLTQRGVAERDEVGAVAHRVLGVVVAGRLEPQPEVEVGVAQGARHRDLQFLCGVREVEAEVPPAVLGERRVLRLAVEEHGGARGTGRVLARRLLSGHEREPAIAEPVHSYVVPPNRGMSYVDRVSAGATGLPGKRARLGAVRKLEVTGHVEVRVALEGSERDREGHVGRDYVVEEVLVAERADVVLDAHAVEQPHRRVVGGRGDCVQRLGVAVEPDVVRADRLGQPSVHHLAVHILPVADDDGFRRLLVADEELVGARIGVQRQLCLGNHHRHLARSGADAHRHVVVDAVHHEFIVLGRVSGDRARLRLAVLQDYRLAPRRDDAVVRHREGVNRDVVLGGAARVGVVGCDGDRVGPDGLGTPGVVRLGRVGVRAGDIQVGISL
mmetsp:Transcript_483/g.794  ORF Transcript_483/g.794 Transcript_483/m.794 type:complete len:422 (+) Transcript_483:5796-7061(+)